MGEASLSVVGVGGVPSSVASGERVGVTVGEGVPEGGVSGDSDSVGVGERSPEVVAVGRRVAVALVSMMRGVGVDEGTGRGDRSAVLVGGTSISSGSCESVGCNRVALGKMVIRGAEEPWGVHEA